MSQSEIERFIADLKSDEALRTELSEKATGVAAAVEFANRSTLDPESLSDGPFATDIKSCHAVPVPGRAAVHDRGVGSNARCRFCRNPKRRRRNCQTEIES